MKPSLMLRSQLAAAVIAACACAQPIAAATLPNGVAAGDTDATSTVLWARAGSVGDLTFEVSTAQDFSTTPVASVTVNVADTLLPAKTLVSGLNPATTYYYKATDFAGDVSTGQFRTPYASGNNGLRFGVSGDWRGELSPYPAVSNAAARELDFFVALGDTVYADYASPAVPAAQASTLAEYRAKHAETITERYGANTIGDLRASTTLYATIDDHEVINDFAGGAPATSDARFSETSGLINDTQLYETGLQAFQEYMPVADVFYGDTGDARTANERDLYRARRFGSDAAMFMLDARSFRDQQLTPVADLTSPAEVGGFLAAAFDPSRTMLGDAQVARLKADLLQAQADGTTWKFVMMPEPIQNLGPLAGEDRYEGYAAERTEILKFIGDNAIHNVVFVTADIHGTLVNNLTYQESAFGPQVAVDAWEISTGSVAFDAPFGQTVADLALAASLIDAGTYAFYQSLPVAPDLDTLANDKDDFMAMLINQQIVPLGYDPIGLQDNIDDANGLIDAQLLLGDYVVSHTFGWTEFEIDPLTHELLVTTYGISAYDAIELSANGLDIAAWQPGILSQFSVAADPVPVPAALPLFLSALGVLGSMHRRRV